jgi:DNA-directed RNA polymerase specialized sigma24 family protein
MSAFYPDVAAQYRRQQAGMVYNYVRRGWLLHDAQDIVQTAFVRVLEGRYPDARTALNRAATALRNKNNSKHRAALRNPPPPPITQGFEPMYVEERQKYFATGRTRLVFQDAEWVQILAEFDKVGYGARNEWLAAKFPAVKYDAAMRQILRVRKRLGVVRGSK